MNETWKEVPFAVGYEVSDKGNLRSRWEIGGTDPTPRLGSKWRQLKGSRHKLGYLMYGMNTGDGERIRMWAHRLVATVFIGEPPFPGALVRHIDGNSRNNNVTNLAWGTSKDNSQDMVRHGKSVFGDRCKRATLKNYQAREIVQMWAMGMEQKDLANMYNVSPVTVSRIVRGEKWSSVTGLQPIRSTTDDPEADNPPEA